MTDLLIRYFGPTTYSYLVFATKIVFYSLFIWFPVVLIAGLIKTWMVYIQSKFIAKQGSVLLEIKLPREILKSPVSMEVILSQMYAAKKPTLIEAFWEGTVRPWFSLEIISEGGHVRFFIWSFAKYKNLIESQIYAHYPNVEVVPVPDYASKVEFNPIKYGYFGVQYGLTKPDPYPIKTYVDYGLDKDPKEEFKTDPLVSMIEYMGTLKKDEQMWFQIIIRGHRKESFLDWRWGKKPDWKDDAKKEIKKIASEYLLGDSDGKEAGTTLKLTKGQQEAISAIERSLGKQAFDTIIRGMYLAKTEAFNGLNIPAMIGMLKQYGSNDLNGFKLQFATGVDYPWQDFRGIRQTKWKKETLDAYKRRSFFHEPYKFYNSKPFVLNVEELATLFHFPGGVASTPSFARVQSRKAESPPNLPI